MDTPVRIVDRAHPHVGAVGVLTGTVMQLDGQRVAEVKIAPGVCCFISRGQIQIEQRQA